MRNKISHDFLKSLFVNKYAVPNKKPNNVESVDYDILQKYAKNVILQTFMLFSWKK